MLSQLIAKPLAWLIGKSVDYYLSKNRISGNTGLVAFNGVRNVAKSLGVEDSSANNKMMVWMASTLAFIIANGLYPECVRQTTDREFHKQFAKLLVSEHGLEIKLDTPFGAAAREREEEGLH